MLAAPLRDVEVADCGPIEDAELRGECQLYAAFTVGSQRGDELAARCAEVDEGVWRDECHFLGAEHQRRRRDRGGAAALCAEAGRFSDDCGQHLWQTPVKVVVDQHLRSMDLAAALEDAAPIYCEWIERLPTSDIESRFWRKLFGGFFEHREELEPDRCGVLDEVAEAHCRAAVAHVYLRRIHMLSVAEPELLCGGPATVESLSGRPNLRAEPDPLLQAVLDQQVRWACELREGGLPPMGAELLQVEGAPVSCSR